MVRAKVPLLGLLALDQAITTTFGGGMAAVGGNRWGSRAWMFLAAGAAHPGCGSDSPARTRDLRIRHRRAPQGRLSIPCSAQKICRGRSAG